MRRTASALALLALAACAEPLPVHVLGRAPAPELADACDLLGVECELAAGGYGAIELELRPVEPPGALRVRGVTTGGGSCSPSIWVERDARLIAHELAHALGLEHRDDADAAADEDERALMAPISPGLDLDDEEMSEIERGGNRLVGCRL